MAQAAGDSGRGAIIAAAADCFMEAGYAATSIDTVADRLGATVLMVPEAGQHLVIPSGSSVRLGDYLDRAFVELQTLAKPIDSR